MNKIEKDMKLYRDIINADLKKVYISWPESLNNPINHVLNGKGKRLRPYSFTLPKPLIPIGKLSTLEILIKQLINHGIKHITLCLNYKGDLIETFINKKKIKGAIIDFSHEKKSLGTFGPLSIIKDLPENCILSRTNPAGFSSKSHFIECLLLRECTT